MEVLKSTFLAHPEFGTPEVISFWTWVHLTNSFPPSWGIELRRGVSVAKVLTTVLLYCTIYSVTLLVHNCIAVKTHKLVVSLDLPMALLVVALPTGLHSRSCNVWWWLWSTRSLPSKCALLSAVTGTWVWSLGGPHATPCLRRPRTRQRFSLKVRPSLLSAVCLLLCANVVLSTGEMHDT